MSRFNSMYFPGPMAGRTYPGVQAPQPYHPQHQQQHPVRAEGPATHRYMNNRAPGQHRAQELAPTHRAPMNNTITPVGAQHPASTASSNSERYRGQQQQQQQHRSHQQRAISSYEKLENDLVTGYMPGSSVHNKPSSYTRPNNSVVEMFSDRMAAIAYNKGRRDPSRLEEGRLLARDFLAKRSEGPHADVITIVCRSETSTSLHDSIHNDVIGMLLEELDDWASKVGENGSGIPFIVKKRAFTVFSSNRGSAFATQVAKAFRMVPDRMRFRRCISRLVSRRGYAKALRWIRALNLPLTYSVTKILLNLLVRGQLSEIRAYFDVSPVERAPFLKIVDKILGLRYQERLQFLEENKVRGLKFWSLTERNLTRAIIRLLPKNEEEAATILKQCVNMNRCKCARLFKDIITKTFVHESMTENKYASLVRGVIGTDNELAEMLVNCLFDRDLWREAQVWMDIYRLSSPELIKQLRRYQAMEGMFGGPMQQQMSYMSDGNMTLPPNQQYVGDGTQAPSAPPLKEIPLVPMEKVRLLVSSECCLTAFDHILENSKVIALDVQWKPVLKKGMCPTFATLQIATSGDIYILDIAKMEGQLSEAAASKLREIMTSTTLHKIVFGLSNELGHLAELHPQILTEMSQAAEGLWDFKGFRDRGFDFLKALFPEITIEGPNKLGGTMNALLDLVDRSTLTKPPHVRCADWSIRPLTPDQMQYAATEAKSLLTLYDSLKAKANENSLDLDNFLDMIPKGRTRSPSLGRTPSCDEEEEEEEE